MNKLNVSEFLFKKNLLNVHGEKRSENEPIIAKWIESAAIGNKSLNDYDYRKERIINNVGRTFETNNALLNIKHNLKLLNVHT